MNLPFVWSDGVCILDEFIFWSVLEDFSLELFRFLTWMVFYLNALFLGFELNNHKNHVIPQVGFKEVESK